jgi:hypothetical protein
MPKGKGSVKVETSCLLASDALRAGEEKAARVK